MPNLYFRDDDLMCYNKQYHLDYMKENNLKELEVYKAKRVTGGEFFFCQEFLEVCERGQCGVDWCGKYTANNGKNGRCKYYGYCYEPTEKVILRIK